MARPACSRARSGSGPTASLAAGGLPDEIELGPACLFRPPTFAEVAPLADRLEPDRLGRPCSLRSPGSLCEGRTLFVIDEAGPARPVDGAPDVRFPGETPRRPDLLHLPRPARGTARLPDLGDDPAPRRPNRPALTAQGVVADLASPGPLSPGSNPIRLGQDPRRLADPPRPGRRGPTGRATDLPGQGAAKKPTGTRSPVWSDAWLEPAPRLSGGPPLAIEAPSDAVGMGRRSASSPAG